MQLSRRSFMAAMGALCTLATLPTVATGHQLAQPATAPSTGFTWNRRVKKAQQKGETTREYYYKKQQMARYRPYIQTASR